MVTETALKECAYRGSLIVILLLTDGLLIEVCSSRLDLWSVAHSLSGSSCPWTASGSRSPRSPATSCSCSQLTHRRPLTMTDSTSHRVLSTRAWAALPSVPLCPPEFLAGSSSCGVLGRISPGLRGSPRARSPIIWPFRPLRGNNETQSGHLLVV